jgi:hypothetical protein
LLDAFLALIAADDAYAQLRIWLVAQIEGRRRCRWQNGKMIALTIQPMDIRWQ